LSTEEAVRTLLQTSSITVLSPISSSTRLTPETVRNNTPSMSVAQVPTRNHHHHLTHHHLNPSLNHRPQIRRLMNSSNNNNSYNNNKVHLQQWK
jgi:hypothetical protein